MKYSVRKMRINEEGWGNISCSCASPVLCVRSVGAKVATSLLPSSSLRLVPLMSRQITSCLDDFTSCCDVADAETCFATSPVAKRKGSRKGKRKSGKGNEWWGGAWDGINPLYYINPVIRRLGCMKGLWGGGRCQTLGGSHQVCTQAAVVRGTPVYSAAPGVASSPTRPAGQLWSLPPTDAPSVASYTKQKRRSHV